MVGDGDMRSHGKRTCGIFFVWRMICCGASCAGDAGTLDSERKLKYEELFFE
ncbi:hypothetical protein GCM10007358_13090 [Phocicoccus schoeneichii]|nr:hypothetical protein GCM10007358_13090 [Jeotgalicoccus schoeneichii]